MLVYAKLAASCGETYAVHTPANNTDKHWLTEPCTLAHAFLGTITIQWILILDIVLELISNDIYNMDDAATLSKWCVRVCVHKMNCLLIMI